MASLAGGQLAVEAPSGHARASDPPGRRVGQVEPSEGVRSLARRGYRRTAEGFSGLPCVRAWKSPAARCGATGLGGVVVLGAEGVCGGGAECAAGFCGVVDGAEFVVIGAEWLRRFGCAGVDVPAYGDAVGAVRVDDSVPVFGGRLLVADGD